jgi:NADPH:quinone reductase-like Zn-dependent oxidoreductase
MLDQLLLGGCGMTLSSISTGSHAGFGATNRALALHRLRPVNDRVFPLAQAIEVHRHFESRAHFSKVVISHGQ